jgi:hypothetical protein
MEVRVFGYKLIRNKQVCCDLNSKSNSCVYGSRVLSERIQVTLIIHGSSVQANRRVY